MTPWTVARQAPLSMAFSRQEYWSGTPFSPLGILPNPGTEPTSPALAGRFFTAEPAGKPLQRIRCAQMSCDFWKRQVAEDQLPPFPPHHPVTFLWEQILPPGIVSFAYLLSASLLYGTGALPVLFTYVSLVLCLCSIWTNEWIKNFLKCTLWPSWTKTGLCALFQPTRHRNSLPVLHSPVKVIHSLRRVKSTS